MAGSNKNILILVKTVFSCFKLLENFLTDILLTENFLTDYFVSNFLYLNWNRNTITITMITFINNINDIQIWVWNLSNSYVTKKIFLKKLQLCLLGGKLFLKKFINEKECGPNKKGFWCKVTNLPLLLLFF